MTAPKIDYHKFWIVKPAGGTNYIKNPRFDPPDGTYGWAATSVAATIESYADDARRGAYSIKVRPVSGENSGMYYHAGLPVNDGSPCTFSCDVKGVAGQVMKISITNGSDVVKDYTQFTATGYWQRVEVGFTAAETATDYKVFVLRNSIASVEPFYVDGAQFEMTSSATTLIHGYAEGCRWTGTPRKSYSYRSNTTAAGGRLLDLDDYCHVVQAIGLGHGDWNQIMTKMTSGGDMYQTHIRKSRNFSIVVDFVGSSINEIEANRKAIIDAIRPDLAPGQERIIRYQGLDINGQEATQPLDIVCVPLPATLTDIPELPTYQRAILNFTIPSGLLQGAYNEGAEMYTYTDFPAEYIVKRDANGNWCEGAGGGEGVSLITGLNERVLCMAEGLDGKIYAGGMFTNAGTVAAADYLARWNPISEAWEAVGTPNTGTASISAVQCLAFDSAGNLYVGGNFTNFAGIKNADYIAKFDGTNWAALETGANGAVFEITIGPDGDVYVGGAFTSAGGVANTAHIAKWDGTAWTPLSTGLNDAVRVITVAPNGLVYIGGDFTSADGSDGDYLCYWNGTVFHRVGTVELDDPVDSNPAVNALAFGASGHLYVGGQFIEAGGVDNANYIARWNGKTWQSLGTGTNYSVLSIEINSGKLYAGGAFTSAGGIETADRIAVWNNGAWQPLEIDLPGSNNIHSILVASDDSLYIGGAFSTTDAGPNAQCGIVSDRLNALGVSTASANTYPYMQVHGPGTLKAIKNYTTGKSVMFDGLTLNAGEWIGLQFDPLNLKFRGGWDGRGNLMRYVVAGSDYGDFYLKPGSNALSLFMTGTDSNSGAWITWTPLFWGLDGALL